MVATTYVPHTQQSSADKKEPRRAELSMERFVKKVEHELAKADFSEDESVSIGGLLVNKDRLRDMIEEAKNIAEEAYALAWKTAEDTQGPRAHH